MIASAPTPRPCPRERGRGAGNSVHPYIRERRGNEGIDSPPPLAGAGAGGGGNFRQKDIPKMRELSLGISPCPNDVYIFSGLLLGAIEPRRFRFKTIFADVENLNQMTQRGELDVAKISYANYIKCANEYELLSSGGALGRGVGPLLLTNGAEFSTERPIHIPGEFTTANFLLDFYLQKPVTKIYEPFDVLYENLLRTPGAQGVVIHEKRFTYAADGLTLIQDLGEHWEAETGYPIPLGAIAARKTVLFHSAIEEAIRDSLEWAKTHDAEAFALCREHSQDLNDSVIRAHIDLYVNDFSIDLGPEGRAAIAFFLERQAKS